MDDLVTPEWLAEQLRAPDLVVLDASKHLPGAGRDAREEYVVGHIPGARFLDLAALVDLSCNIPNAMPSAEQFARHVAALGIAPDTRVVLYDDSHLRSAARAWFVFSAMGWKNVAILDGGLENWRSAGFALESGEQPVAPATPVAATRDDTRLRSKRDMLANCGSGAQQVIDARDPARFAGLSEDTVHGLPGGHIPGARNLFFRDLLDEHGRFKSRKELRKAFDDVDFIIDRPVAVSCGSGMTACVVLFALHLLGIEDAALYDGSWSEWGADPDTPKQTGAAT